MPAMICDLAIQENLLALSYRIGTGNWILQNVFGLGDRYKLKHVP